MRKALLVVFIGLMAFATVAADTGDITRVSVRSNGDQANDVSFNPDVSADGRYTAFASDATNLVEGDTNGAMDIFVHDRDTGATSRVRSMTAVSLMSIWTEAKAMELSAM